MARNKFKSQSKEIVICKQVKINYFKTRNFKI